MQNKNMEDAALNMQFKFKKCSQIGVTQQKDP